MRGMRRLVPLAVLAAALVVVSPAGSKGAANIHFSFQAYANNVRVVAPLVGRWQLGKARLHGSGDLGSGVVGSIVEVGDPLDPRYSNVAMRAQVVGYHYLGGAHGSFEKLTLTIQITSATNGGPRCDPGVQGTLTIFDSNKATISNGETADYVVMGHWQGARCPTFVQGWTNADGGPRTSPGRGGPGGGQWAVVRIDVG